MSRFGKIILLLASLHSLTGCDSQLERFDSNEVFALTLAKSESVDTRKAQADVSQILESLFGTPDNPVWPADYPAEQLVVSDRLRRAAGNISSDQDGMHLGLFREHCVVCHAVEGSGSGPASQFQNPYPRDFRPGIFKWKSTERAAKPTRADLKNLLMKGIPGTGMPSFSLLEDDDLEALVDYVIYLSVRGETERRLLMTAIMSLGYGSEDLRDNERLRWPGDEQTREVVDETLQRVIQPWVASDDEVSDAASSSIDQFKLDDSESIAKGKELFHGKIANCVGCHGTNGGGGLETLDYDDWTKEYTTKLGLSPSDKESVQPFREVGAHRPRPIQPRKIRGGVFRAGAEPQRLFRLITQGIAGTPMPGVALVQEENGKGLTASQVWDLVNYLRSLQDD